MEINRSIVPTIIERLIPNKVNLIFGTRRVGKTYLLKTILANTNYKTMHLQGEDTDIQMIFAQRSLSNYRRFLGDTQLLVIDEAQAIPEIGKVLKLIVDNVLDLNQSTCLSGHIWIFKELLRSINF